MRVIEIDFFHRTVTEKNISGDLESLQKIVGGLIETAFYFNNTNEDVCYVNEEGLFAPVPRNYFMYFGAHQPFAGNAVIVGTDEQGNSVSTNLGVDYVKAKVKFMDENTMQLYLKALNTGEFIKIN